MERHAGHAGFRALAVTAQVADDSRIIAFAYGFRGANGQWWHDVVRSALTAQAGEAAAAAWLESSLEIAEVHVHPDFQRRGIGRSLLLGLTAGRTEHTAVLSTQDDNSPARAAISRRWLRRPTDRFQLSWRRTALHGHGRGAAPAPGRSGHRIASGRWHRIVIGRQAVPGAPRLGHSGTR